MNDQMLVLFIRTTGHVLSALTMANTSDTAQPKVSDLVGEGMPLSNYPANAITSSPPWTFTIPATEIDLVVVTSSADLLANPFDFTIGNDRQPKNLDFPTAPTFDATTPVTVDVAHPASVIVDAGIKTLICMQNGTSVVQSWSGSTVDWKAAATFTGPQPKRILAFVADRPVAVSIA